MNDTLRESRSPGILLWILIVGGVGFAAGFIGPMVFAPEANQGPLVGIFISGPGGAFLGLILFVISHALRISPARQWPILWISCALLAGVTLYSIMPEPALRGHVIDAQIEGCRPPAQGTDAAVQYWEKRVAAVTWAAPRPHWQEDARQMLQYDQGVILDVMVVRSAGIYEEMKPWNNGRIIARNWIAANDKKSYYAPTAAGSCKDYPAGTRLLNFSPYDLSGLTSGAHEWPPKGAADFLDLQVLEPIPDEYRKLIGD